MHLKKHSNPMNPVKPNPNFFPPNKTELNPDNSNAHNRFLSKNQHWTQTQARLFCQKHSTIPLDQHEVAQQILIGLWQALLSYNPIQGASFRTFATQTSIRQRLPKSPQKSSISFPNNNQAQTAQLLYQGYAYEEIGKLLGLKSKSTTHNIIRQIRQNKAFSKALSEWIADKNNQTTTKSEKKCWKTQRSSFSPEQNLSFLLLIDMGLLLSSDFGWVVVKKTDGKESGEAAGFSAWKTRIVRLRAN